MDERTGEKTLVVPAWLVVVLTMVTLAVVVRFVPSAREAIGGAAVGTLLVIFARGFWASLARPTISACVGNLLLVAFATAVVALFAELVGGNGGSMLTALVGAVVGGLVTLAVARRMR